MSPSQTKRWEVASTRTKFTTWRGVCFYTLLCVRCMFMCACDCVSVSACLCLCVIVSVCNWDCSVKRDLVHTLLNFQYVQ